MQRTSCGVWRAAVVLSFLPCLGVSAEQKAAPARSGKDGLRFTEHLIMSGYTYPYGIAAADLDGDGDLDLTSADAQPHNCLYWFENDGAGTFRKHFVQKNDPERLERHAVADVNGDKRPNVVIVKNLNGHLLWFENSGKPAKTGLWKRHVITTRLPGAYDVVAVDLDKDGDLDVAGSSWSLGNQFAWFENPGKPADQPWKKHMIEEDIKETRTIRAADFDRDGDVDLLGTAPAAHLVVWYENGGKPAKTAWKRHVIDSRTIRPMHGEPVDMDRDGDLDVVMASGMSADKKLTSTHEVVWYENSGKPKAGPWKKHVIAKPFTDAIEAVAGDLDGDGDVDVAATTWRNPGAVAWFENTGDPRGRWTKHVLKMNWRSANQIVIADLNGDKRPDLAAVAEHGSYEFLWWRNEGKGPFTSSAVAPAAAEPLSFSYDKGRPVNNPEGTCRLHEADIDPVRGKLYVYATFDMGPTNPLAYVDGKPQGRQIVAIGQNDNGKFVPAVRFGLHDGRELPHNKGFFTTWLFDGKLNYYGMYARPNTPYDFKLQLDLDMGRMTAWVCGRGDDDWFLFAEDAPLINPVTAIDAVRVEQYPQSADITGLEVRPEPNPAAQRVRPHPKAKAHRAVAPGKGFKFQSMRSFWRKPGRHVTIIRNPPRWFGFPDVVQTGPNTLGCTHNDGVQHGGGGGLFIRHSSDLGRTWGDAMRIFPGGVNCPRLQKLRDGSLLLLADVAKREVVIFTSRDGGHKWTRLASLTPAASGGNPAVVPSRVTELADGSWLLTGSWYPGANPWKGTEGERLEFFRSTDRGKTWKFLSHLQTYPPHSLSEASILVLPDDRLLLYARENRGDGFPALKAYSDDHGKTWKTHELPFSITGRTCAGFLEDGRVMLTFRSGIGRAALWAWVGDPHDTTLLLAAGAHSNDRRSVGLKGDALHIDNDGIRGQCTQYFLRQPDSENSTIDLTVVVKVVENKGRAATVSIPYAGKFRIFPDRVELAHASDIKAPIAPGAFHTIRIIRRKEAAELLVDGKLCLRTDKLDKRTAPLAWTPANRSLHILAFGNEPNSYETYFYPHQIPPEITGCSIWRSFRLILDDPRTGKHVAAWSAARDGFPDQYQLDHIIEVDASISAQDQGYSGWINLDDGRIFLANYTDDTAPAVKIGPMGISWIRGTYLNISDLPPAGQ